MDAEGGGVPIWSRGKFQKLLSLAMDVPEVEKKMRGPADIHERLNEEVGCWHILQILLYSGFVYCI